MRFCLKHRKVQDLFQYKIHWQKYTRNALAQAGIRLYGGVSGSADGAVEALLAGSLNYNPDEACTQHQGEANHQCAHHHGEGHEGCHSGSCT